MRARILLLGLLLAVPFAARTNAAPIDEAFPTFGTGGIGGGAAISGDTLFLGGSIRWVGPLTGGGVPVAISDLALLVGAPHVNGSVLCTASDGAGGWYIGGTFDFVGGAAHQNLAHILPDLSVDSWSPSTDGAVNCITVTAQNVYFAGSFGAVNGAAHSGLAGVSRSTGATTSLNPSLSAIVQALANDGSTLYVGGEFTTVQGQPRGKLAAFRLSDHSLLPWNPSAAGPGVYSLAVANGVVYAGGFFSQCGGQLRSGAAALDPVSGLAQPWDPSVAANTYGVRAILTFGDHVILGGDFTSVGGVTRHALASVDTDLGALLPWDPEVINVAGTRSPFSPSVNCLALAGTDILAGGTFEQVGSLTRQNFARIDAATGIASSSALQTYAETRALAVSGSNVLIGGRNTTVGGGPTLDLVAVRLSTGEMLPWLPDATHDTAEHIFGNTFWYASQVIAVAVDATRVYMIASFFDPFASVTRQTVNAYSRATGARLWNVEPFGTANALAVVDDKLVVGGDFSNPSTGLLAFDPASGATVPWGGSTTGAVRALTMTPAGLAVGGDFTQAGGQPRSRLAMLDPATGLATSWDPGANLAVRAIVPVGSTLFCGGDFTTIGGQLRERLAAIPLATSGATAWNPGANDAIYALAFDHGVLFAGGAFTTLAGAARASLGAVNPDDGSIIPWNAAIGASRTVFAIAAGAGRVFALGSQTVTGTEPTSGFSPIMAPDPTLSVPAGAERPGLALRIEPQPVRFAARVRFRLATSAFVDVGVYDAAGRRVATLAHGTFAAGEQGAPLDPAELTPGLYFARIAAGGNVSSVRFAVLH